MVNLIKVTSSLAGFLYSAIKPITATQRKKAGVTGAYTHADKQGNYFTRGAYEALRRSHKQDIIKQRNERRKQHLIFSGNAKEENGVFSLITNTMKKKGFTAESWAEKFGFIGDDELNAKNLKYAEYLSKVDGFENLNFKNKRSLIYAMGMELTEKSTWTALEEGLWSRRKTKDFKFFIEMRVLFKEAQENGYKPKDYISEEKFDKYLAVLNKLDIVGDKLNSIYGSDVV